MMDIKHSSICRCKEDDVVLEITTSYEGKGMNASTEYRLVTSGDVIYLNAREFSALTRIIGAIAEGLK